MDVRTKYALVDGTRREADKSGLRGTCQFDGHPMVARCGPIRKPHWAHLGAYTCDPWWESETQWHRDWKALFPAEWQEVLHVDKATGEKHIADVETDKGWVFEFQHSRIKPEERQARDAFYPKLIWIVDGTRRKKDVPQFASVWKEGRLVGGRQYIRRVRVDGCALLQEWSTSSAPVLFDLGMKPTLWWLLPKSPDGKREYIGAFSSAELIRLHRNGTTEEVDDFAAFLKEFSSLVSRT